MLPEWYLSCNVPRRPRELADNKSAPCAKYRAKSSAIIQDQKIRILTVLKSVIMSPYILAGAVDLRSLDYIPILMLLYVSSALLFIINGRGRPYSITLPLIVLPFIWLLHDIRKHRADKGQAILLMTITCVIAIAAGSQVLLSPNSGLNIITLAATAAVSLSCTIRAYQSQRKFK